MIERTTFDLRLADHAATTARINDGDWRRQGESKPRTLRPVLAAALVALAARLDPASVRRLTQPV
jgi:hypothetical protein